MSQLKNFIKDLFDLNKPVNKVGKKLALVIIVLLLETVYYTLTGIITGFGIFTIINWDFFVRLVIKAPLLEGFLFWGFLWMILKIITIVEELKGFKALEMNLFWLSIILIGIIFGLGHLASGNPLIVAIFVKGFSGILYGWLVVKTRSLWPNILAHALWNFLAMIFFY